MPDDRERDAKPSSTSKDWELFSLLLKNLVESGGEELHFVANSPPLIRSRVGALRPAGLDGKMDVARLEKTLPQILTTDQERLLRANGYVQLAFGLRGVGRFTGIVYRSLLGSLGASFLLIHSEPFLSLDRLGVSQIVATQPSDGLRLIGGNSRSGRSSTLSALLQHWSGLASWKIVLVSRGASIILGQWHPRNMNEGEQFAGQFRSSLVEYVNAESIGTSRLDRAEFIDRLCPDLVAVDGWYEQSAWELMLDISGRGIPVIGTCFGSSTVEAIGDILLDFSSTRRQDVAQKLAARLRWCAVRHRVTRFSIDTLAFEELLVNTPEVQEMLGASRLDNLAKIVDAADPATPHVSLDEALELLVRRGRIPRRLMGELRRGIREKNYS